MHLFPLMRFCSPLKLFQLIFGMKPTSNQRNGKTIFKPKESIRPMERPIHHFAQSVAIQEPETKVQVPVELYRFCNPQNLNHFYSTNFNEGRIAGFHFLWVEARIYPSQMEDSSPWYCYYNETTQAYRYTADIHELGEGNQEWIYQGIVGYVSTTPKPQHTPMYRYYSSKTGDYFYSTDFWELGSGNVNYEYQGVCCYVYPRP